MNPTPTSRPRSFVYSLAVLASGVLWLAPAASAQAATALELTALADEAQPLPVTTAFAKDTSGKTDGPYVLTVTNTSKAALKVHAAVASSVVVHNQSKTRKLPPATIEAGGTWKVDDLAAGDKITIHAKGYKPLEVVVP